MITTRASSDNRLGVEFQKQVFGTPQPLLLSAGVLVALAAFPGLPKVPFLLLGGGLGTIAWQMKKRAGTAVAQKGSGPVKPVKENLDDLLRVEPLSIEMGVSLVSFIADGANSPLLRRIGRIRKQLATELGFIIPSVRVTDNLSLRAREYSSASKESKSPASNCPRAPNSPSPPPGPSRLPKVAPQKILRSAFPPGGSLHRARMPSAPWVTR